MNSTARATGSSIPDDAASSVPENAGSSIAEDARVNAPGDAARPSGPEAAADDALSEGETFETEPSELSDDEVRAQIDAEIAADRSSHRLASAPLTGAVLLFFGAVGWVASLILTMDKMHQLANPDELLACDVNPFISCGTVMASPQASTFVIPNMTIGLAGFAVMACIGSLLLSRAVLPQWFRYAQLGGMIFAFVFVHWLAFTSIFVLRTLCPWCLVVWASTAPMFFASLAFAIENGDVPAGKGLGRILRSWVVLTVAWYLLVVLVIAVAFFEQWLIVFGLA